MSTLKVEALLKKQQILKEEEKKFSECNCEGDPECGCAFWLQSIFDTLEEIEARLQEEEQQ